MDFVYNTWHHLVDNPFSCTWMAQEKIREYAKAIEEKRVPTYSLLGFFVMEHFILIADQLTINKICTMVTEEVMLSNIRV